MGCRRRSHMVASVVGKRGKVRKIEECDDGGGVADGEWDVLANEEEEGKLIGYFSNSTLAQN